ncbi:MAG: TauD/TfdA family dioxygenase [Burkholderiaceae bacterium]|nr:TauD/TfdA family dioxygenase [Burkholderiaceae bacterium]MCD8517050.1 TauD/TfdA family dioxygenase [Burkholderiaceae bacterium]MCD8536902.1 TauD/TfdA family dioxygenase [Burkholderiaceae bacterium]MCD8566071.1 TauD/TfdA family dioxygenase [Burkholderiaceae bacterium]
MNAAFDTLVPNQPKAWKPADLKTDTSWRRPLTEAERAGLLHGLRSYQASGIELEDATGANFDFKDVDGLIRDINNQLMQNFGLVVLKHFPIEGLSEDDIKALYWGFVNHLGVLRPQGKNSALMNHVKNLGGVYRAAGGRGYNTNAELDFHVDFADYVGLLCIQDAKSGGISRVCSSRAIIEDMQRNAPELAQALMEPLYYSRQDEEAPDELPYYRTPVVGIEQGWFSCRFTRNHIRYASRHEGASAPSEIQDKAMDWIDSAAQSEQYTFEMRLEPGDLQILNNHVALHSRTAYEDYDEPERKRSLLRSWIAIPHGQPLSPLMKDAFHDHRAGAVRGGIKGQMFDERKQSYTRRAAEFHKMLLD